MMRNIFCWLLFSVATFTWLQAASGRNIHHHRHFDKSRFFADDDMYFRGEKKESDNQPEITEADLPKNGELFEGDMIMDNRIRQAVLGIKNDKRSGVISSEVGHLQHWPNGVIPYTLNDNLKPVVKKQILKGIKELKKYTCVKYIPRTDEVDYVDFQDGRGCSSSVGRQGGKQVIHLAGGCKRIGTVVHEMMHTMGIIHEQSRPDRDDHVLVQFNHIKKDLMPNFRKYSFNEADNLDIPYNYYSVMHYSNYAFSKDDEKTLIAKADHSLKFGQRMELTRLDIEQINRLYPCEKKISIRDARNLIPNMTERDVEKRKRDMEDREEQEESRMLDHIEDWLNSY